MKKTYFLVFLSMCFGFVSSQYYSFDPATTGSPYQQGCAESLSVKVSTDSHPQGAKAARLHVILDPEHISYSQSSLAADLRTNLFEASTTTFLDWSSESSPSWKAGTNFSILQIDRKNNLSSYNGNGGLYGTLYFVPRYSPNTYSTVFGMEYNGEINSANSTIETTLSSPYGTEIINPTSQHQVMTGVYPVLQQPCVADTQAPNISVNNPLSSATKQRFDNGVSLILRDAVGVAGVNNVPFVWSGGIWTGNIGGALSNQYGIDLSSFRFSLSGNGQSRTFFGSSFSSGGLGLLQATPQYTTWQGKERDYSISIGSGALFNYGIEKTITVSIDVKDRIGYQAAISYSFNQPQGPSLIPGTRFPLDNANFVAYDAPIRFGIQDDWAGVNTSSVIVSLSGINGTVYGPYVFSGTALNFSGLVSQANQPNQYITLGAHPNFPGSGTILVSINAKDMEGNQDTISDYTFQVRPSCKQLGCCDDKYIYYKNISSLLTKAVFTIQGGINPYLSVNDDGTGYLNCGVANEGLSIYKGVESASGSAQIMGFFDGSVLRVLGNNVKAVLSGSTLFLQKIFEYGSLSQGGGRGGGGGSNSLKKDKCPGGDYSPSYYDSICGDKFHNAARSCIVKKSPYSQEITDAFQFSYSLGVTTICPIDKADIKGNLLRSHLAKMISEYAITVVGLYPDTTKKGCDRYSDMSNQSSEMKFYSKIVCQLGLMGLESDGIQPQSSFNPNSVVTRAQFGTILSRLIFGNIYNVAQGDSIDWYANHLNALKEHSIMKMIDEPKMPELRGYVMLMLQRTYESGIIDQYRFLHTTNNSINALLNADL